MKRIILIIISGLIFGTGCLFSQSDTLEVIYEFNSPAFNSWGLTWDGTNFWISDMMTGTIYKSSPEGLTLDSIEIKNAQITGICFINDTLWGVNTMIVDDTTINTSTYPVYFIYQIDKTNGDKLDSLKIIGSATNLFSGDLWGLTIISPKI
ncbi:MAG: hypothetical protein JW894_08640 [Bacteroidales bacterium]|nr:hypothetical protein [Bacteroidales bacterium]